MKKSTSHVSFSETRTIIKVIKDEFPKADFGGNWSFIDADPKESTITLKRGGRYTFREQTDGVSIKIETLTFEQPNWTKGKFFRVDKVLSFSEDTISFRMIYLRPATVRTNRLIAKNMQPRKRLVRLLDRSASPIFATI